MEGVSNGVMMGTGGVESPGSGSGGFEARPMKFQNNQQINSDWSDEEQAILEQCLAKYAAYNSTNIARYAKISLQLNNKTVRDVALRCRWMAKRESEKKMEKDSIPIRKMTADKKAKLIYSPGWTASNNNGNPALFNATVQLLQHNSRVFDQISTNLTSNQIQDNIILLRHARENLFSVLTK
ncbi:unnamed protein product [Cuscuta europaea]|uniref:Myb-like domain-containing protein n=1 Tax=Cuscuta europaea TaxID=41803 RepID=A0A9P0ZIL9_CUSEU|nr:unnamed protein product [Cuscuta europaea]